MAVGLKKKKKKPNKNYYSEPRGKLMKFLLVALCYRDSRLPVPHRGVWLLPASAAGRRGMIFLFLTKFQEEHQQH